MKTTLHVSIALLLAYGAACATTTTIEGRRGKPVWEDPDRDPYNFYRSVAMTLLRTRQYPQAMKTIKRMRKLRHSDPEPDLLRARAEVGLKQFGLAVRSLKRALELDGDSARAHAQMGELLNVIGRHRSADKHHLRSIELAPEEISYRNNYGFGLYLQKKYRRAITAYRKALEQDASAKRVHNNLAFAYGKVGDMDRAYTHFNLAGLPAQAHNNLAFVYEQRGLVESAYTHYLAALRDDPRLIQARRNLERVCAQLGRDVPEIPVEPGTPMPTTASVPQTVAAAPAAESTPQTNPAASTAAAPEANGPTPQSSPTTAGAVAPADAANAGE